MEIESSAVLTCRNIPLELFRDSQSQVRLGNWSGLSKVMNHWAPRDAITEQSERSHHEVVIFCLLERWGREDQLCCLNGYLLLYGFDVPWEIEAAYVTLRSHTEKRQVWALHKVDSDVSDWRLQFRRKTRARYSLGEHWTKGWHGLFPCIWVQIQGQEKGTM